MGLLTSDTGNSASGLSRFVLRAAKPLSLYFYLGGIVYFGVNVWPSFNYDTYLSEHSLLPGVADNTFNLQHFMNEKLRFLDGMISDVGSEDRMPYEWLYNEFLDARLEAQVQNFTVRYPLGFKPEFSGRNVFGVVRAPRGASNEAIVVAVPYDRKMLPAVALLLALAKFARNQVYWAKDLFFVVAEKQEIGMQAWLNAYHGMPNNEFLEAQEISIHSGPIQAAVALELSSPNGLITSDISYNMINGQLPNLDLVNVAVKLAERTHLHPTIYGIDETYISYSWDGYTRLLTAAVHGIVHQAVGQPGLHQVFGQFNIEAVTLRPRAGRRGSFGAGSTDNAGVARMMEGMLRSINNLLERFHQSFFFYLLLSPYRYMSIGVYMPAIAAMVVSPLFLACALWLRLSTEEEAADKEKEPGEKPSDERKKDEDTGKEKADETQTTPSSASSIVDEKSERTSGKRRCSISDLVPYFVVSHVFGVLVRLIPDYAPVLMRFLEVPVVRMEYVVAVVAVIAFYSLCFPLIMKKAFKFHDIDKASATDLFRCLCLLELGVVVGVISLVNFGLGFILCLTWVPIFSIVSPTRKKGPWSLKFMLMLLANPLVLVYLGRLAWIKQQPSQWDNMEFMFKVAQETIEGIFSVIVENYLFGSWMFTIVTAVLYPMWMQFWALLHFDE